MHTKGEWKMARKGVLKNFLVLAGVFLLAAMFLKITWAYPTEPVGPNYITVGQSTRMSNTSFNPKTVWAEAGNITGLDINATTVTRSWQGYYGNVTGNLVLMDAWNNTMYDWQDSEPQGEIYASINSTINWATVRCFNTTAGGDSGNSFWVPTTISAQTEHDRLNMNNTDPDAINNTFTVQRHPEFNVGTVEINESYCYSTATYINNKSQVYQNMDDWAFIEVLLTDGEPHNAMIFTTFIENRNVSNDSDRIGFDGQPHDFQMMVLEDGHPGPDEDQPTLYYFWVELQ